MIRRKIKEEVEIEKKTKPETNAEKKAKRLEELKKSKIAKDVKIKRRSYKSQRW
jgi:hypothetical protein